VASEQTWSVGARIVKYAFQLVSVGRKSDLYPTRFGCAY